MLRRRLILYFFLCFVSFLFFLLDGGSLRSRSYLSNIAVGTQQLFFRTLEYGFSFFSSFNEMVRLREEYQNLELKFYELEKLQFDYLALEEENKRLKEALELPPSSPRIRIIAEVIGRDISYYTGLLTINRGQRQGIFRNDTVVARAGKYYALVGRVFSVAQNTAQVLPLVNEKSYIPVFFENSSAQGLLHGRGELSFLQTKNLVVDYVLKEFFSEISEGSLVLSSGLGGIYPKNYPIGKVRRVYNDEGEYDLKIHLQTLVSFNDLTYVYVFRALEAL